MATEAAVAQFIDEKRVAELTGFSLSTLRAWRFQGRGPVYHKIDGRSVRYKVEDVEAFMESYRIAPEAE